MIEEENILRAEAIRLAKIQDVSVERAERALRSLIAKGLIELTPKLERGS